MARRLFFLLIFASSYCWAQPFSSHQLITLESVFAQWDEITKNYTVGLSIMQPQKIRFSARYLSHPQPCSSRPLEPVFNTLRMPDALQRLGADHCIKLSTDSGRVVVAWVQGVLVPGLKADAVVDGQIEIYADLLAYAVGTDRSRNMPFMIVGRFEPK